MKILWIVPEWSGGGIGTYYRMLYPEIKKYGVDISIAFPTVEIPSNLPGDVICFSSKLLERARKKYAHLKMFPLLWEHLAKADALYEAVLAAELDFDLLEISEYPLLAIPWLNNDNSIPIQLTLHGSLGQLEYYEGRNGAQIETIIIRSLEDVLYRKATEILALSKMNAREWEKRLDRSVKVIPPFFPMDSNTLKSPSRNQNGLVMGRLQSWKGPEALCSALDSAVNTCPEIHWVGGENFYKSYNVSMGSYLKQNYKSWGEKIMYLGKLSYEKAQEKLDNSAFLLVPSIWDTFNFTVVEGMIRGKIVICSNKVGASEHITHEQNGFIYSVDEPEDLIDLLTRVKGLSDSEKQKIESNARKTAIDIFVNKNNVELRIELYKKVLKSKSSKSNIGLENRNLVSFLSDPSIVEYLISKISIQELFSLLSKRIFKRL